MPKSDNPSQSFLNTVAIAAEYNKSPEQNDPFWVHESVDAARWNQSFPYQLLVVKREANGKYTLPSGEVAVDGGIGPQNRVSDWSFTLPFPPESLQIQTPFAIAGSVTQGGYMEEHGGTPLRMISLSGTFGVLPARPAADTRRTENIAEAIFGGTLEQANRVAVSAQNLGSNFSQNNSNFKPNLVDDNDFTSPGSLAKSSGYYQMRLLQYFFENYAAFKKTSKGSEYRLAFAMWKDQSVYLVTPTSFTVSRNAGSPFEYMYSLGFKAYRRISLDGVNAKATPTYVPVTRKPNALARALKALLDARDVLENARDVIGAIGGDLDRALFEPMRQTTMFLKDILNVPLAFADLPVQVLNNCQESVAHFIAVKQAYDGASETFRSQSQRVADAYKALANLASNTSKLETGVGVLQLGNSADPDPALDVFRHPEDHYDIFKDIGPGDISLPTTAIRSILREREAVRLLKRLDFEQMRDSIMQLQADFADAVGAGHTTFSSTFQRPTPVTSKVPTPSDFRVMFALNRVAMEMNRLAATSDTNQNQLSSVSFLAGLARGSGIAFREPRSKFAVPMPYGVTIEQLAKRYLGDPDRWLEIVALNGLRAPYVDEVGFDVPLLVNGNGNQIVVADSYNLYVGQQIWLASNTTSRTMRRITKIDHLSTTNHVVTVDGDSDLSRFHVSAGAGLHAFLPDTVNSMMMLYMPSDQAPTEDNYQTRDVPSLSQFDQILNVGGFDLLLTQDNDLAITPDGDCRLAVGLQNIVQTARIRLSVTQGTLNRHPSFGLPIKVGMSVADLSASELLKATKNLFVDDPTFTGVVGASVFIGGPTAKINLSLGVRGQSQLIPITLDLK
jgi:hypothetical protein